VDLPSSKDPWQALAARQVTFLHRCVERRRLVNEEQALAVTSKALLTIHGGNHWEAQKNYMVIIYDGMRQTWSEGDRERERFYGGIVFLKMIYDKISMVFCCGIVLVGNT
jgi:hypothetical protein